MNKDRRKRITIAMNLMKEAWEILTEVKDEEKETYENSPGIVQNSERGEQMEIYISILEDAIDNLDTSSLEEITG